MKTNNINREATKVLVLSSGEIDKYEYLKYCHLIKVKQQIKPNLHILLQEKHNIRKTNEKN